MINQLYDKYAGKLPDKLVNYTGDEVLAKGLISLCNPEVYSDLLADGYEEKDAYVFAVTAFGDLLIWEKGKYVNVVSFSNHKVSILESGFEFFMEDILDENYLRQYFNYDLYLEALNKLGKCSSGECYVSSPIPVIGGELSIDKLTKGKIREYNAMSIDMAGKL